MASGPSEVEFEEAVQAVRQYLGTQAVGWAAKGSEPLPAAVFPLPSVGQVGGASDPEPLAAAVAPGAVAIGSGGFSLNPDTTVSTPFASSGVAISDQGCSAANRGEIRLKVLSTTAGGSLGLIKLDALCLCTKREWTFQSGVITYHWSCFHSDTS